MPMLSRVADSLYWMGRYIERAEHMARVLEVSRDLLIDLASIDPEGAAAERRVAAAILGTPEASALDVVFDATSPASLVSAVTLARENARQVREVIAAEMWEHLNQAYWTLSEARSRSTDESALPEVLTQIHTASYLWDGVTDASMPRGEGWLFLKLGKFVERTDRVCRTIAVRLEAKQRVEPAGGSHENVAWVTLLRSCAALDAYRKTHPNRVEGRSVLAFLAFSSEFPRTVRHSVTVAGDLARRLSAFHGRPDDDVARAFGRLSSRVEFAEPAELGVAAPASFFTDVAQANMIASSRLARKYFLEG
ncbi:MAG: alpha-E domain-containing protein [Deltaproteobacteria bacterium]|nr:alpha-E domain-containing protein [Deltaproteobacteria bacterium]